ncbi:MAG: PilZ domain-containing protein [Candidatus Omnitrophica bacterium]|nr:PilZ domain-containing protein [Candidatus Omnitrophota bacterium]
MYTEKREFHRINITCKVTIFFNERQSVFNCHTENLSGSGTMVTIEKETMPAMIVDLELFLWHKEVPLKCKGEIAWVNEIAPKEVKPRLFNAGIKFIEISDSDRDEIKDFVNTMISTWQ